MPTTTTWTDPEMYLEHAGVKVFRTYKDNEIEQGANLFSFTCDSGSDDNHFDVGTLEVPSRDLLNAHPPFLSADVNLEFATASLEQKSQWKAAWHEWHREGGGKESAVRTMLKEAIDLGLIKPAED